MLAVWPTHFAIWNVANQYELNIPPAATDFMDWLAYLSHGSQKLAVLVFPNLIKMHCDPVNLGINCLSIIWLVQFIDFEPHDHVAFTSIQTRWTKAHITHGKKKHENGNKETPCHLVAAWSIVFCYVQMPDSKFSTTLAALKVNQS